VYLIAGLGNPGSKYDNTRHNIGFRTIDLLCQYLGASLTGQRFQSRSTLTRFQDNKLMLLCPSTFMNRSGEAVRACVDYYNLEPGNILVIHDDIDLPVGRIKVVGSSGSGGHKGIRSIVDHLGGTQFQRIKIGIGRPRYDEPIEDYVLSPFYKDERDIIENVLRMATEACELYVSKGIEPAMNQINCQNLLIKEECK
jgi:PTH1 family peptidyl-tRNA hydrolase